MKRSRAQIAFSALGHGVRLDILRLLVRAGEDGLLAGELAEQLEVLQNTMSANLSILMNAGLIWNKREGRSIRYFADLDGIQGLLDFFMDECCQGRPEVCQPEVKADVLNVEAI